MLLKGRSAIVYGAGGAIGGAVARAFAREGARVFVAGRTHTKLDAVAVEILSPGGTAEAADMLGRVETLDDVGNVAAYVASDLARSMTATSINIAHGRVAD